MAPAAIHSELQILFACARVNPDLEQVRACASREIDWHQLAAAAEFHGLNPLLCRNLQASNVALPKEIAAEMEGWNSATVRQNLFLSAELLRVHVELREHGIEAIPLKGPVLASELYGDLALRPFSDIDLLIKPGQVDAAESVVRDLGYEPEFAIPPEHRKKWLKQQCELTFRRSGTIRLELHWDIAHPHFALDTGVADFWSRLAIVQIGDSSLPNLSSADLLFTLIVHGTRHAWSRMMWLVDIAELLRLDPLIDLEEVWRNAEMRGAARMMATGLVLAERALDVPLPKATEQEVQGGEIALDLADRVIDHWNQKISLSASADPEPTAMWR